MWLNKFLSCFWVFSEFWPSFFWVLSYFWVLAEFLLSSGAETESDLSFVWVLFEFQPSFFVHWTGSLCFKFFRVLQFRTQNPSVWVENITILALVMSDPGSDHCIAQWVFATLVFSAGHRVSLPSDLPDTLACIAGCMGHSVGSVRWDDAEPAFHFELIPLQEVPPQLAETWKANRNWKLHGLPHVGDSRVSRALFRNIYVWGHLW